MPPSTVHRNIAYRLLPGNSTKARKLAAQAGACRFVWNEMLGRQKEAYDEAKAKGEDPPSVSQFSLQKRFTQLRRDVPWLKDYHAGITRSVLKYQAEAWERAFTGGGLPRFKKRGKVMPSFTIPEQVRIRENRLYIPRMGWYRLQRKGANPWPDGRPVKAVIRKISADRWQVTICYKVEVEELVDNGVVAGLDMNVGQVAVVSSTNTTLLLEQPKIARLETRIKRNQRAMARKKKGSSRQQKLRHRHLRLMRKKANRRKNWHHHVSKEISRLAGTVVVERLNTKGMTKSAKGTVEDPGKNVKAKSGLNREILNTGWTSLVQMLGYKCREVIGINPAFTSQTCHACQEVNKEFRKGRRFKCVACGHADHADLNAARNILASGIGAAARRGALALATPTTREKDREGDLVNQTI